MNCERALDRMLEAGPEELRAEAGTELSFHVRGCDRCRRTAGVLLAELESLDRGLRSFAGAGDPEAAIEGAIAASRAAERGTKRTAARLDRRYVRVGTGLGLAAAAALAAILLGRSDSPPAIDAPPDPAPAPAVAVTPPPHRGAAVLQTRNPDITVVWLYDREES